MGQLSYMRSIVDRNVMWRIPVISHNKNIKNKMMTRTTKNIKYVAYYYKKSVNILRMYSYMYSHCKEMNRICTWADIQTTLLLVSLAQYFISLRQDSSL
jgi:hypothetical protein